MRTKPKNFIEKISNQIESNQKLKPNMGKNIKPEGPWEFSTDSDLGTNSFYRLFFRDLKFNKTNGYFRDKMPFDNLKIQNRDSSEGIKAHINGGNWSDSLPPSATNSYSSVGVTKIKIENTGSNPIPSGEIIVSVSNDGYDADDQALEQKRSGPVSLGQLATDLLPGVNI